MIADKTTTSTTAPEPRTPVMILVEATWNDQSGTARKCSARMENRSTSGACIRLRNLVAVGAKLHLRWRWEEFTGIARYCRSDGRDFLVGLQKIAEQAVETKTAIGEGVAAKGVGTGPDAAAGNRPHQPNPQAATGAAHEASRSAELPAARRREGKSERGQAAIGATEMPERAMRPATQSGAAAPGEPMRKQETLVPRRTEPPREAKRAGDGVVQERKHMRRKWFELGHKGDEQEPPNSPEPAVNKAVPATSVTSTISETRTAESGQGGAEPTEVELLSMADMYQTAGILNPRKGYSILKVAEMLRSEHLRGLSKEMKKTTLMVALDAAGITVAEVAEDAKARIEAIDSYEAEQRKQFEAHLARKAEENQHLMAELERIKASYAERLRRNLEGVAREKATFGNWLTAKQQEAQNIAEALELFTSRPEITAANKALEATLVGPSAKPV